jgi:hypothetical protein
MGGSCSSHVRIRNLYKIRSRYLKGRDHSEDLDVDEKIILE